jgi:Uma2 family endonuclease
MKSLVRIEAAAVAGGFTAAEFLRMVNAGAFSDLRVELVAGEIVKMMPAYMAHGEANGRLFAQLLPLYAGTARLAIDLIVQLDEHNVRAVDIAVTIPDVASDRAVDPAEVILAVEIAETTLGRDLGEKLAAYARSGIPHYWVVDLAPQVIHVMADPAGETYRQRSVVRFTEPLAVPTTAASITIG